MAWLIVKTIWLDISFGKILLIMYFIKIKYQL